MVLWFELHGTLPTNAMIPTIIGLNSERLKIVAPFSNHTFWIVGQSASISLVSKLEVCSTRLKSFGALRRTTILCVYWIIILENSTLFVWYKSVCDHTWFSKNLLSHYHSRPIFYKYRIQNYRLWSKLLHNYFFLFDFWLTWIQHIMWLKLSKRERVQKWLKCWRGDHFISIHHTQVQLLHLELECKKWISPILQKQKQKRSKY